MRMDRDPAVNRMRAARRSRKWLLAKIESDGDADFGALVRGHHMLDIARKQHHQPGLRRDIDEIRHRARKESGSPRLARIEQTERRGLVPTFGHAGIDVVGAGPSGARMVVHPVEVSLAVHVGPGLDRPAEGLSFVPVALEHLRRGMVRQLRRAIQYGPAGGSAELKLARIRMPAAAVALLAADASPLFGEDGATELRVERRTVAPGMPQEGVRKDELDLRAGEVGHAGPRVDSRVRQSLAAEQARENRGDQPRTGTMTRASPSITTVSPTWQTVLSATRAFSRRMSITVTVARTVSPIRTGARNTRLDRKSVV